MKRKIWFNLELSGVPVTYITGLFLHYSYLLSDKSVWSIVFGSVNASVWEHIKVFAMPYILWSFIELSFIRVPFKKFVVSKVIGLYTIILSIGFFCSAYFGFIGHHSFLFDIITSLVFVFVAHIVSYNLSLSHHNLKDFFIVSIFALALFFSMYLTFSVAPPKINLFLDHQSGSYGLIN